MPNKENEKLAGKKKVRSLLIEPTAEEEELVNASSSQCPLFCGHYHHSRQQQQQAAHTTDKRMTTIRVPLDTCHRHTNQVRSAEQSMNVISTANGKNKQQKQQDGKRFISLLSILFGSVLIVCLIVSNKASELNRNATISPVTVNSSNSTTARTEVPTTTPIITTTATEPVINSSSPITLSLADDLAVELTTTTTNEEDSARKPTTAAANDGELLPTSDDDDESDEPSAGGSRSFDRKLMLDSASDAADHLLARLKSQPSGDDTKSIDSEDGEEDAASDTAESNEPAAASPSQNDARAGANRRAEALTSGDNQTVSAETEIKVSKEQAQLKYALDMYAKWRAAGDDIIELFSRKMLPVIVEHGYDVDSVTVTGLLQVFNGIRAIKPWALKLLDASAKITPGLLVGTQSDFGDFDECLSIRVDDPSGLGSDLTAEIDESTGLKSSTLVGRYCLADVEFPKPPRVRLAERNEELQTDYAPIELRRPLLNFNETADFKGTVFVETANFFHMLYVDPIRVGLCLTNKIDPESFAKVLNQLVKEFGVSINFNSRCVTKYDKPIWTTSQKVSAYILLVACSLVLICTALDLLHTKLNKWPLPRSLDFWKKNLQKTLQKHRPLFTSFSIIRNTKRLFKAQPSPAARLATNSSQVQPLDSKHQSHAPSSTESSPSIERRGGSSPSSSAINLISGTSSELSGSCSSGGHNQFGVKTNHLLAQFDQQQKAIIGKQQQQQKVISGSLRQHDGETKRADGTELNLVCLHGIRVITMTWMIVNHTYLFGGFFVLWAHRRLIDIAEWPKSLSFQLVLNGWLTVETYFFLSAAIIVLNALPLMKARRFNYFAYILHRLVRLLPAYVGLVSLNFLWPLISSGPVWLVKGKSFIQTPCENYLWTNFLFINNWIWPEKQCMVHTWFLSADFQLYLLAPILVYLLYRRPVLGHSMNIIVAIIASVFSGFVIYANKLMPTTLINKLEFDSIKQQLSYSYFATYQHMGPYCLGIFIGYLLYKRPNVKLPRHLTWLLWILLPPLSFTTLLLTYLWNGAYGEPNLINPSPLVSAVYVAIHRTIWTSLLAWIVFACATGRAKLISNFLSHSMFIPLSRLSFSIYLVHLPVIMFRALNLRHTIEWTDTNILWEACGNFIASIVIGYFVNVTFESPIINLEQVIFGRPGDRSQVKKASSFGEGKKSNLHILTTGRKSHSNSLVPQLISISKTSSDNDSDDNKSAQTTSDREEKQIPSLSSECDQTSVICESQTGQTTTDTTDGFTTPTTEGSPQSYHHQRPLPWNQSAKNSFNHLRQDSIAGHLMEPPSQLVSHVSTSTKGIQRDHHHQQVAPANIKLSRKFLSQEQPSDDSIGSSIYPISVSEYQNYLPKQVGTFSAAGLRSNQYATLARTSRFAHDQSGPLGDRLEQQRQLYYPSKSSSHLGASIATYSDTAPKLRHAAQYRQNNILSRRQTRYNTLTGLGSREYRQSYAASLGHLDTGFQQDWQTSTGWNLQPGTMIPRIDSSTLRRRNEANVSAAAGSIIEEHEDAAL